MTDEPRFEEWCVLEVMGHRRLAGRVTEVQIAGASFLRIDILGAEEGDEATQFYPPASIYCITPCTEEAAREAAKRTWTRPANLIGIPESVLSGDPDDDVPF